MAKKVFEQTNVFAISEAAAVDVINSKICMDLHELNLENPVLHSQIIHEGKTSEDVCKEVCNCIFNDTQNMSSKVVSRLNEVDFEEMAKTKFTLVVIQPVL